MSSVPWNDKMRRLNAEWIAPEEVTSKVCTHYLESLEWMAQVTLNPSPRLFALSARFLFGSYWQRFRHMADQQRHQPLAVGILRADHRLEARFFTQDGTGCHLIDHQTGRRMATYNPISGERVFTQDLGSASVVYFMRYDMRDQRWKIEQYVQELPRGWHKAPYSLSTFSITERASGRDQ